LLLFNPSAWRLGRVLPMVDGNAIRREFVFTSKIEREE